MILCGYCLFMNFLCRNFNVFLYVCSSDESLRARMASPFMSPLNVCAG